MQCSHAVQNAKKPKVFGYGWPPSFVNVSMETVHIQGIVEYNLLYNRTCPDSCYCQDPVDKDHCEEHLSPVDGCFFVENQTSILPKSLNCIVCNSSENCKFMGITEDHDLCLCLKVTTLAGSSNYTCMERNYKDICEYYILLLGLVQTRYFSWPYRHFTAPTFPNSDIPYPEF